MLWNSFLPTYNLSADIFLVDVTSVMPTYTAKYTHYKTIESEAYKHFEAANHVEAKKLAAQFAKDAEFDQENEVEAGVPVHWRGHYKLMEGEHSFDEDLGDSEAFPPVTDSEGVVSDSVDYDVQRDW